MDRFEHYISHLYVDSRVEKLGILDATRVLLMRCGFEVLEHSSTRPWILFDMMPWSGPKAINHKLGIQKPFHNWRLHWAIHIVTHYLNREQSAQILSPTIFQYEERQEAPQYADFIRKRLAAFSMPYPIEKDLTDYGCNNRTCIVRKDGQRYLCKVFRGDRLRYLHNELNARPYLKGIVRSADIVEHGESYVLMEYLPNIRSVSSKINRFGYYPLLLMREILLAIQKIYENGCTLLDIHSGNILLDEHNKLLFIDFEYVIFQNPKVEFLQSPFFVVPNKVAVDAPLEDIGYEHFWASHVQVTPKQLIRSRCYVWMLSGVLMMIEYVKVYLYKIRNKARKMRRRV